MQKTKKQTAVDWLINNLIFTIPDCINTDVKRLFQQAKEIEKEQITNAYWDGGQDIPCHESTCERYYQETYENK